MISRIKIEGFRCFKSVEMKLGEFNLLVGANGTGKSSVLEAMRVIAGVGKRLTIGEIFKGEPSEIAAARWDGIEGSINLASFRDPQKDVPLETLLMGKSRIEASYEVGGKTATYALGFNAWTGRVLEESLTVGKRVIFDSRGCRQSASSPTFKAQYNAGKIGRANRMQFEINRPVIVQMAQYPSIHPECSREHYKLMNDCLEVFKDIALIDPDPRRREQSKIMEDREKWDMWLQWMVQLTPREVFINKLENTYVNFGSFSLGGRRFVNLTHDLLAATEKTLMFRGIDNYLSPLRVKQLIEIFKSQASDKKQIIATTHSPVVLSWLDEADYATTFLCRRDEKTGAAEISSLDQSEEFAEMVKRRPISNLFAEEWLEGMM